MKRIQRCLVIIPSYWLFPDMMLQRTTEGQKIRLSYDHSGISGYKELEGAESYFQLEPSRARPVLADGCLSMRLTLHDVAVVLQRGASFRSAFSSCVEHDTEPRHPCDCRHF